MAIDIAGRIREALDGVRSNIATQTGVVRYVDANNGNANYDGLSREQPMLTINAAILASSNGDVVHIARGTYDEAVDVVAGHVALKVICEPGVYIINTTPGTAVQINSAQVYWEGGVIEINGQVGFQVNATWFTGKNIQVYNSTIGFDMNSAFPVLINCRTNLTATAGFDIAEDSGWYLDCHCQGDAASRGFYLSNTAAEDNMLIGCTTNGCTANGFETVAGADNNAFINCSQSILCAGPADAGANNTWVNHGQDSQISAGNTKPQDLKDIYDQTAGQAGTYFEQTVAIQMNTEQTLNNTAANKDFVASNDRGGQGLVSTVDANVEKAFLLIIGRAVNVNAGTNDLDCSTASHNQWKMNLDGGAWSDLVNGAQADGQMLDTDWWCQVEGAIHPFTFLFDITSQLTNVDGNIGVRLENGRASSASLIVTCDIYLKILWKL